MDIVSYITEVFGTNKGEKHFVDEEANMREISEEPKETELSFLDKREIEKGVSGQPVKTKEAEEYNKTVKSASLEFKYFDHTTGNTSGFDREDEAPLSDLRASNPE